MSRKRQQPPPTVAVPAQALDMLARTAAHIWAETDRRPSEPQAWNVATESRQLQLQVLDLMPPAQVLRTVISLEGGSCGNYSGADPGRCLDPAGYEGVFHDYSNHRVCTVCMLDYVARRLDATP